jgi:hypothetical protein
MQKSKNVDEEQDNRLQELILEALFVFLYDYYFDVVDDTGKDLEEEERQILIHANCDEVDDGGDDEDSSFADDGREYFEQTCFLQLLHQNLRMEEKMMMNRNYSSFRKSKIEK